MSILCPNQNNHPTSVKLGFVQKNTGQHNNWPTTSTPVGCRFSGLALEWWRWISQESREEMLNAIDTYQQILTVLGKEFYGPEENEYYEHPASLFMSAKIYDLNKSEEYFCYMQKLLISSGNADKSA